MTKLAETLKRELEAQGMTQQELADAAGTTQPAIYKIVNGKTKKPRILPEIAIALGVTIDYLLGLDERKTEISEDARFERMKSLFMRLDDEDLDKGIEYMETLAANHALRRHQGR